ncbi:double-strand break repair protein MRE11 [Nematocida sp. AWRm77]|nr:double-strand break repair protein MRE11 [Nematocida sp. AWRm77]
MENELRILVTTDNHLGYLERDHIRGEDSFRAFEEVFELAAAHKADCILMCGDMFHEVHPSKYTMYRTMQILQKYCVGDAPIYVECLDNKNFKSLCKTISQANYYSENINISLPVFSIHGNHDEPSGYKGVAALDVFAEARLINYFGRMESLEGKRTVSPVVLKKGRAVANIYGIGALRDERITKMFAEGQIEFEKSPEGINLLVLHQTRCSASSKTYLPEDLLSADMDLVIWGHMHLSEPIPKKNLKMGFSTIQPGSTVQTSLCQAESKDKHCVLLTITENNWTTVSLPMQSTRKLVFKNITAKPEEAEYKITEALESILCAHREALAPLVRLRVELDREESLNLIPRRVLGAFKDRVANPKEILRIVRKRRSRTEETAHTDRLSKTEFVIPDPNAKVLTGKSFMQGILDCINKEDKTVLFTRYEEIVADIVAVLRSHRWTDIDAELALAVKEVERKYDRPPIRKTEPEEIPKKPKITTANEDAKEDYAFTSLWD